MYGVLCFTSKSRVQGTGVPFFGYNSDISGIIVHTKKTYTKDMWAKVHHVTYELMEIIGETGDQASEVSALRGAYGLHYKYPSFPLFKDVKDVKDKKLAFDAEHVENAYTVDNASTLDRDDAISVMCDADFTTIGIHITDLASRLHPDWLNWARLRGSSAYWESGTKPIFPPSLAHDALSLTKGKTYPCLSFFLKYKNGELQTTEFGPRQVAITGNLTYEDFASHPDRAVLETISGKREATEIIEWCMIQYNMYVAVNLPDVLLRVQDENMPARYDVSGTHFSMDDRVYTHATSPIRRFADFYNQCLYYNQCELLTSDELAQLNKRMNDIQSFHRREIVMNLAYKFKSIPTLVDALIVTNEDGKSICLWIDGVRVWIPLSDSYYEQPICDELIEGMVHTIECFGIHKAGKAALRIRLADFAI